MSYWGDSERLRLGEGERQRLHRERSVQADEAAAHYFAMNPTGRRNDPLVTQCARRYGVTRDEVLAAMHHRITAPFREVPE